MSSADEDAGWAGERQRLLERVREKLGSCDPRVLDAIGRVPRHVFVPDAERAHAYEDRALPIGEGQTISQPSMVAIMLDELGCRPDSRVLEVGAGSGYAAALLAELAASVVAVEIRPELAERARRTLVTLGIGNVHVVAGDGSRFVEDAPFDRILVSAAPTRVPEPLVDALAPGGRIAIPVGDDYAQALLVGEKDASGSMTWRRSVPCIFVPLVDAR